MKSTQHLVIDGPTATARARAESGPSPHWRALSLFSGFGGLDRAFTATGRFSVVSAGDLQWGHDIADFDGRAFEGVYDLLLAGPPCQKWSSANRTDRAAADEIDAGPYSTHAGIVALRHLWRVIDEVRPRCVLIECVPGVPTIRHPLYGHYQRLDLRDSECGGTTRRLRHWQWLSLEPRWLRPERNPGYKATEPAALATLKGEFNSQRWANHVRAQGFDQLIGGMPDLSAFTLGFRWRLVGNAVPLTMGRVMASAVIAALSDGTPAEQRSSSRDCDCECGCGRVFNGRGRFASKACAKRVERRRQ